MFIFLLSVLTVEVQRFLMLETFFMRVFSGDNCYMFPWAVKELKVTSLISSLAVLVLSTVGDRLLDQTKLWSVLM